MAVCLYPLCRDKPPREHFFRVPSDTEIRKKWMSAIPQVEGLTKDDFSKENLWLCSRHFPKSVFQRDPATGKIKRMNPDAVPSIFVVPANEENTITVDENLLDELVENDKISDKPPDIPLSVSDTALYIKVQNEEYKVLVLKEKIRKEEEDMAKAEEHVKDISKGKKSREVEEIYSNLMKKMKPIAPKRPLKRRPKTLEEIMVHMRKEKLMSREALYVLLNLFADIPIDPTSTYNKEGFQCWTQYLAFYNSEVFEKLSSFFDVDLPPMPSVRKLFNTNLGEPGWSNDAFCSLRDQTSGNGRLLCSLLVSEVCIKRKEEWDGRRMRGFVDCGPATMGASFDLDADGLPTARSALILMVVPLQPQQLWRVPVAYFFINRLTSEEKANIIKECILRLYDVNTVVLSVTSDVSSSDESFLNSLGVSLDLLPHICPYFVHPSDPLLRVHVLSDPCSTLTSVQNMWASSNGFQDNEGRMIVWKFIAELIKLQEAQAGSFAQAFDIPQWSWDSLYMKNRLMAQLFSDTTANTMEYCANVLNLSQFAGCEGTVYFIRFMSRINKLLKSRRYLKSKTCGQDGASLKSEYLAVLDYLNQLRDARGELLYSASSGSIRLLYQTLMSCQELLRQVPEFSPHCVCLDEVELVPYIIRTYTGWSSHPTARQFTAAFSAHVEKYGYFTSWSCAQTNGFWWVDSLDVSIARKEGRMVSKPEVINPSIALNFEAKISKKNVHPTSELKNFSASNFMAVCVVKSLADIMHCEACLEALQDCPATDNPLLLLLRKTCGAVLFPSNDVLKVCACAEHHVQEVLKTSNSKLKLSIFEWKDEMFVTQIGTAVTRDIQEKGQDIFPTLKQHILECAPDANHVYRLIRGISCSYASMRLRSFKSWCPV